MCKGIYAQPIINRIFEAHTNIFTSRKTVKAWEGKSDLKEIFNYIISSIITTDQPEILLPIMILSLLNVLYRIIWKI